MRPAIADINPRTPASIPPISGCTIDVMPDNSFCECNMIDNVREKRTGGDTCNSTHNSHDFVEYIAIVVTFCEPFPK